MSTQVFNQILEWRLDKVMTRTCLRPLPMNRISTLRASILGLGLFGAANWLFYKVYNSF
jgi:protoheme IX farnesyltransferase